MNKKILVPIAIASLGILSLACSVPSSNGTTSPTQVSTSNPTTAKSTVGEIRGDGIFKVPYDVKPGTYQTTVPEDSLLCYYARLKSATGSLNDIIANGVKDVGDRVVVKILPTDKYFETQDCGVWTLVQ